MTITDKIGENNRLSVKCVLLTEKSAKKGILSVKLRKILAKIGRAALHLKMPDKVSRNPTSFVRLFV